MTQSGEIVWEYNNPFYSAMQFGPGQGGMPGMEEGAQEDKQSGEAGAREGRQGEPSGRGGFEQDGRGMQGGGQPVGGVLDGSIFKARKVPVSWVPESIELSQELLEASALRHQARIAFENAEALTEQANQVIEKIK